jgi:hypothetical protein
MSPSVEPESHPRSLAQALRTASWRGVRFGAVLGSGIGVVMGVGAFMGGIWSQWLPGHRLIVPSAFVVAKILGLLNAAALVGAAYGAAFGAIIMGLSAAYRQRWRRDD